MIRIASYIGSGKSTMNKSIKNCHEFDEIEELMIKYGFNLKDNIKLFFKIKLLYKSKIK